MTPNQESVTLPAVYGIIVDEIEEEYPLSLLKKDERSFCIDLCNFLEASIDPHLTNFRLEKISQKIVIIDTEYSRLLFGWEKQKEFKSYTSWIFDLSMQFLERKFGLSKHERRLLQQSSGNDKTEYILFKKTGKYA